MSVVFVELSVCVFRLTWCYTPISLVLVTVSSEEAGKFLVQSFRLTIGLRMITRSKTDFHVAIFEG